MVSAIDQLAAYEEFCEGVLPLLRQAIKEGWTREQIDNHPKIQALMAARQITIALREEDTGKALAAIRDHRDRTQGKAVDRREVKHELSAVPDDQLDAMLMSKLQEAADDDEDGLPN